MSIVGIYAPQNPTHSNESILSKLIVPSSGLSQMSMKTHVDKDSGLSLAVINKEGVSSFLEKSTHFIRSTGDDTGVLRQQNTSNDKRWANGILDPSYQQQYFKSDYPDAVIGGYCGATFDRNSSTLAIFCDPLGEENLFWAHDPGSDTLVFSTELEAVLRHPIIEERFSQEAIAIYMTIGWVPAPLTMFEGVQKLAPGESIQKSPSRAPKSEIAVRLKATVLPHMELEGYVDTTKETLIESIRKRLPASDESGVLFSAGIDSTAIVGGLQEIAEDRFQTFTMGQSQKEARFPGKTDIGFSKRLAEQCGFRHQTVIVDEPRVETDEILKMISSLQQPTDTISHLIAQSVLLKQIRANGIRLVFSGINAEHSYGMYMWRSALEGGRQKELTTEQGVLNEYIQASIKIDLARIPQLTGFAGDMIDVLHKNFSYRWHAIQKDNLLSAFCNLGITMTGAERIYAFMTAATKNSDVQIAHPFHDAVVFQHAMNIPPKYRNSGYGTPHKVLLTKSFPTVFPDSIQERAIVAHPGYPIAGPLLRTFQADFLSPEAFAKTGLLDPSAAQSLFSKVAKTKSGRDRKLLSKLLALQLWAMTRSGA